MLISRGSQSSMRVLGIELWPTFLIWKKERDRHLVISGVLVSYLATWAIYLPLGGLGKGGSQSCERSCSVFNSDLARISEMSWVPSSCLDCSVQFHIETADSFFYPLLIGNQGNPVNLFPLCLMLSTDFLLLET